MESHVNIDRMEIDCHNVNSLRCFALENGGLKSHLGNLEVLGSEGDNTKRAALYPITPIPRLENGESVLVMSTSLSSESHHSPNVEEGLNSSSSDEFVSVGYEDSPRTPKEGVFNPFAPGPEDMCLAPCKKPVKQTRRIVARRLNFDDVDEFPTRNEDDDDDQEAEIQSEKMLLETVYESLLQVIIVKLTEEFLAENQETELKDCSTPTSAAPLSGIAETCPGAPAKVTGRKLLNIDPGLCKKLEF
ncbi:hypothetical protein RND81_04G122900 [Saponaria officinalis]|uniref:Uncharacterized protein n=1 Tax=Saponaria officinalis TaxID=3572 RepID=A0AAW1LLD0_SAPOF